MSILVLKGMTERDINDLTEQIKKTILSPEGIRQIAEAIEEAEKRKAQNEKNRRIDPKTLHEPVTI